MHFPMLHQTNIDMIFNTEYASEENFVISLVETT